MFAPSTKNEIILGAFELDKSNFFPVVPLLVSVWMCGSYAAKFGKAKKAAVNVPAKNIFLSEDLARTAELQVGSTVCRVHWDEIEGETTGARS